MLGDSAVSAIGIGAKPALLTARRPDAAKVSEPLVDTRMGAEVAHRRFDVEPRREFMDALLHRGQPFLIATVSPGMPLPGQLLGENSARPGARSSETAHTAIHRFDISSSSQSM